MHVKSMSKEKRYSTDWYNVVKSASERGYNLYGAEQTSEIKFSQSNQFLWPLNFRNNMFLICLENTPSLVRWWEADGHHTTWKENERDGVITIYVDAYLYNTMTSFPPALYHSSSLAKKSGIFLLVCSKDVWTLFEYVPVTSRTTNAYQFFNVCTW